MTDIPTDVVPLIAGPIAGLIFGAIANMSARVALVVSIAATGCLWIVLNLFVSV